MQCWLVTNVWVGILHLSDATFFSATLVKIISSLESELLPLKKNGDSSSSSTTHSLHREWRE
jgi:hypothetical protein